MSDIKNRAWDVSILCGPQIKGKANLFTWLEITAQRVFSHQEIFWDLDVKDESWHYFKAASSFVSLPFYCWLCAPSTPNHKEKFLKAQILPYHLSSLAPYYDLKKSLSLA